MKLLISKLLFLVLCVASLEAQMSSRMQVIMGTYVSLSIEEEKAHLLEEGFNILKHVDKSISSYNPKSPIFYLNRYKKTKLNATAYKALQLSKLYYKRTHGYFDITIGSVTKELYAFGEDERLPSINELKSAYVNMNALKFTKTEASILPRMKIDLGGMGKGFGVDYVSEYFKENNVTKAIIAASGDIRCLGVCKVAINNPFSEKTLASFETLAKETAITTSGNYNRFVGSVKYNHLIVPKSKQSQDKFISLTLISTMPSSDLDAYATAASVMPIQKAYQFLESLDLAYITLQSDKRVRISKNITSFVRGFEMQVSEYFILYEL